MITRVSTFGVVISLAVLGPVDTADAGEARAAPAVRVIVPSNASGNVLERDDLPAPQLEVTRHPASVDVPAIPAFELLAGDRPRVPDAIEIDLDLAPAPPLRRFVDDGTLAASIGHLHTCNKAIAARQFDAAIAACRAATDIWQDNHLAWYAQASAHIAKQEWREARAAVENAVRLRPDRAMYQLYHGIALDEAERQRVRELIARNDPKAPDSVEPDLSILELGAARDALATAIKLAPDLWRAHYYLGRVYRDLGDVRRAAQQFTATIKLHPGHRFGYIALSELYRRWGYLDQALAIATLGTRRAPAAAESWFEVGMAYDAKLADDQAIAAFGQAIALKPGDARSKLQRGRLYVRTGDLANAERDLEGVMRSPDPRVASEKLLAATLLGWVASRKSALSLRDARWDCSRNSSMIDCRRQSR